MTKSLVSLIAAAGLLTLSCQQAAAHGRDTDRYWCHRDAVTGHYHCHNEDDRLPLGESLALIGGLVLVSAIILEAADGRGKAGFDMESGSSHGSELRIAPYVSEGGGAGIRLDYAVTVSSRVGARATARIADGRRNLSAVEDRGNYVGAFYELRF